MIATDYNFRQPSHRCSNLFDGKLSDVPRSSSGRILTRAGFNEVTTETLYSYLVLRLLVLAAVNTLRRDIFGTGSSPHGADDKASVQGLRTRRKETM